MLKVHGHTAQYYISMACLQPVTTMILASKFAYQVSLFDWLILAYSCLLLGMTLLVVFNLIIGIAPKHIPRSKFHKSYLNSMADRLSWIPLRHHLVMLTRLAYFDKLNHCLTGPLSPLCSINRSRTQSSPDNFSRLKLLEIFILHNLASSSD